MQDSVPRWLYGDVCEGHSFVLWSLVSQDLFGVFRQETVCDAGGNESLHFLLIVSHEKGGGQ